MTLRKIILCVSLLCACVVSAQQVKERDQIIYDASTMPMLEDATLHVLLQQLHGVSISSAGAISVSDRTIQAVYLNGESWEDSDYSTLLYTLPARAISKIQVSLLATPAAVYREATDADKAAVLVIDLKDEYLKDTHLSLGGGIGTESRWDSRLFTISHWGKTQLVTFGRVSNIFDAASQSYATEWTPSSMPHGTHVSKQLGFNLNTDLGHGLTLDNSDVLTVISNLSDKESHTQSFMTRGTMDKYSFEVQSSKAFTFNHNTDLSGKFTGGTFDNSLSLSYSNNDADKLSLDSTVVTDEQTNVSSSAIATGKRTFEIGDQFSLKKSFSDLYKLRVSASASFNRTFHDNENSSINHDFNGKGGLGYKTDRAISGRGYDYKVSASNIFCPSNNLDLRLNLSYAQSWKTHEQDFNFDIPVYIPFDIDAMGNELYVEPSIISTFDYTKYSRTLSAEAILFYTRGNNYFSASLGYEHLAHRLRYTSLATDTLTRSHYNVPTPTIGYERRLHNGVFSAKYKLSTVTPDLLNLLDLYTFSSATQASQGNSDLRNALSHSLDLSLRIQPAAHNLRWWTNLSLLSQRHALGKRVRYLESSDIYVTTIETVDRRFDAKLSGGVMGTFGADSLWHYAARAAFQVTRDADYSMGTTTVESQLSRYTMMQPLARFRLTYRPSSSLSLAGIVRFSGHFVNNTELASHNINLHSWRYGLQCVYKIPVVDVTLDSDISLYTNAGSTSSTMNKDDLVWNASLSRDFFKHHLTVKAAFYDILQQVRSRSYEYNAQGFSEVVYNTLPSYGLLSLTLNL